jgi:hypothetical protein
VPEPDPHEEAYSTRVLRFVEAIAERMDPERRALALDFAGHGEWELAIRAVRSAQRRGLNLTNEEEARLDELLAHPDFDHAYFDSVGWP